MTDAMTDTTKVMPSFIKWPITYIKVDFFRSEDNTATMTDTTKFMFSPNTASLEGNVSGYSPAITVTVTLRWQCRGLRWTPNSGWPDEPQFLRQLPDGGFRNGSLRFGLKINHIRGPDSSRGLYNNTRKVGTEAPHLSEWF